MTEITVNVPGQAVPWHRPVLFQRQGRIIVGKRNEDKKWQETVKMYAIQSRPEILPAGPVALLILFRLPRPKTLPKKAAYHIKKPDIDNLAKNIKDALRGSLYRDDSQICASTLEKQYCLDGEKPFVRITARYL